MNAAANYKPPMQVRFEWIGDSFNIFMRDAGVWIAAILIAFIASVAIAAAFNGYSYVSLYDNYAHSAFSTSVFPNSPILSFAGSLISFVVNSFFGAGLYRMANLAVKGERLAIADLFSGGPFFLNFLLFHFVFSILYVLGLILCVFGVFFVTMLFYPGFAMVADGVSAGTALSLSFEKMKFDWFKGGVLAFVFLLIYAASAVPLLLGLLATVPMAIIISALAYQEMGHEDQVGHATISPQSWPPAPNAWPPAPAVPQGDAPREQPPTDDNGPEDVR
jgi:hypothetical protein